MKQFKIKNSKGKIPAAAALSALAALLTAGCTSSITSGKVIAVTERGFGIKVSQQTQNQTPEVLLGFYSSTVELVPTSTNADIKTPNYANTFSIGQTAAPFNFDVTETTATGNYQTGSPSNSVSSQPIVPK